MIIYQSNIPILSKDIARKPKVLRTGRTGWDGRTYGQGWYYILPHWKWRGHKNSKCPSNHARVVILVRNTSTRHVLHLYQVSSKYSEGYLCYRAETRNQIQAQEGEITQKKKRSKVVNRVCDMSSGPVHQYYQVSSKYSKGCSTYTADTKSMHNHYQI